MALLSKTPSSYSMTFLQRIGFDVDAGYGEQRMIGTGMVNGVLLTVVYTEPDERTRLISARKATRHEQLGYYRNQTPD
jgi:uncharacterized DUF497 family protein